MMSSKTRRKGGGGSRAVEAHYGRGDLADRILEALRSAGIDTDHLTPDDVAPIDEFHIRGREATEELGQLAQLQAGQRVLDVGCGLGGTARYLAARYRVQVIGIDLTAEYCQVGQMLSERTGLVDRVTLVTADALTLPFKESSFDTVWSEHVAMNIANKHGLYREIHRVLRRGGRLALYDIVKGEGGPVHFPVPWARRPDISFLVSADELKALLERNVFRIVSWRDSTLPALEWFRHRFAALKLAQKRPLGFHVLLGSDAQEMFANQVRNLEGDRIRLVQAVAEAH
jgi:ubiquinone/menaquinone biosynthesis C-methylase UbiE